MSDKEINLIQNNNYDTAREIHNLKRFKPEVRAANKADLISLFKCPIWVKEIENGYSKDHVNSPWLDVYTKIGPITIGWRSSVISIDWEGSDNKTPADELFPNEQCTKYGRLIHAWGLEKARDYIGRIVGE